jgi:uncharacterized membrane protein
MRRSLLPAAVLVLAPAATAQQYTLTPLTTIRADLSSTAGSINENGVIAGRSAYSGGSEVLPDGTIIAYPWLFHGVRWENGALSTLGVFDEIHGVDTKPHSINDHGQIVGESSHPDTAIGLNAFLWLPAPAYGLTAGPHTLPQLPGGGWTRAFDVNNNGWIAGTGVPPASVGTLPYLWRPSTTAPGFDLTTLDVLPGGPYGRALAVNDLEQVVGWANARDSGGGSITHATMWLETPTYGLPVGVNDLTPSADSATFACDVNESGEAAGRGEGWTPMLWLPAPAHGLPAGPTNFPAADIFDQSVYDRLGVEGALRGEFAAINNQGDAVGFLEFWLYVGPNMRFAVTIRGIARIGGVFHLVQELPGVEPGWTIGQATDVSDAGQITGYGTSPTGENLAIVISPVPCPADRNDDGAADVFDLLDYLSAWFALDPSAELTGDDPPLIDVFDLLAYLDAWFVGC